jgi:hypothetical protein
MRTRTHLSLSHHVYEFLTRLPSSGHAITHAYRLDALFKACGKILRKHPQYQAKAHLAPIAPELEQEEEAEAEVAVDECEGESDKGREGREESYSEEMVDSDESDE